MKTILITGATDGIGRQTAFELAEMGHEIILHGRNEMKGLLVRGDIFLKTENENIHYINADLSDFDGVNHLVKTVRTNFNKLDVLINNAGVISPTLQLLPNGYEKTFMVNHLAPFSLTLQLLDLLSKSEEGRIVNVSSQAQATKVDFNNLNGEKFYDSFNAYAHSKLFNLLFTYKLSRQLKESNLTVNALHPGVVDTKLLRSGWGQGGLPVEKGAETEVFVSISDELKGKNGLYFVNKKEHKSSAISYDQKAQDRLWKISLESCGLDEPVFN